MLMKECKKCGSKNLYLEPRIKGQDILTADMVALKCKSCGKWIKWCPKNERVNYLKIEKPDKWQKLKEWLVDKMKYYNNCLNKNTLISAERQKILCTKSNQCFEIITQMEYIEKELEGEDE